MKRWVYLVFGYASLASWWFDRHPSKLRAKLVLFLFYTCYKTFSDRPSYSMHANLVFGCDSQVKSHSCFFFCAMGLYCLGLYGSLGASENTDLHPMQCTERCIVISQQKLILLQRWPCSRWYGVNSVYFISLSVLLHYPHHTSTSCYLYLISSLHRQCL